MNFLSVLDRGEKSDTVRRFDELLQPKTAPQLEAMAALSHALTIKHFGRVMRLFAPLYLSNECINSCSYCGFSKENAILRVTLEIEDVLEEARHLASQGFRQLLLVAGEHPKFVSNKYLEQCVRRLASEIPSIGLEVAPMDTDNYVSLVHAGAETLVVYQETYDRDTYAQLHTSGPKKNFEWRLASPERAYAAGFKRLGVGALFGLRDWREEASSLATHIDYLLKNCWKSFISISLPRIRPAAGGFVPRVTISDREYVQLICAFRICFPQVGIVLSTREPESLRDALIPLGVTLMSAGSHTEPGGYTRRGSDRLHVTTRGKIVQPTLPASVGRATEQFSIADERSPREIAGVLRRKGFEPVWKDWDKSILAA
jgi:2-iminoacetate synthase